MNNAIDPKTQKRLPRIVELVGVAGAGKSTLRNALMKKNGRIKTLPLPSKFSYIPTLARVYFFWLPLYLAKYRHTRWFTWSQIRNMGYLDTWISTIRSAGRTEEDTIIIDPGSVYWLADLQEFGPEISKHPSFQKWWKSKLDQWSAALELILWLDAPEELCVHRIMTREEEHGLKHSSFELGIQELKRYREWYQLIIPKMTAQHPMKMFYFRSDQTTTEQMVGQICSDPDLKWMFPQPHETVNPN